MDYEGGDFGHDLHTNVSSFPDVNCLQESLQRQRDRYYPVARCGAQIFALIEILSQVNPVYSLGSDAFVSLFSLAISLKHTAEATEPGASATPVDPPALLQRRVLGLTFRYILGSVLSKDRLLVLLLFVRAFCLDSVVSSEWEYLLDRLKSESKRTYAQAVPNPLTRPRAPSWIPEKQKESLARLLEVMPGAESAWNLQDENCWRDWVGQQHCQAEVPEAAQRAMTPMHKLLLIHALKPHLFESALERSANCIHVSLVSAFFLTASRSGIATSVD